MGTWLTFWDPLANGEVVRGDGTLGCVGTVNGADSAILGGPMGFPGSHLNCGITATILTGTCSFITASGYYALILNGVCNCVDADFATITNGDFNCVSGSFLHIGHGRCHSVQGTMNAIHHGYTNLISPSCSGYNNILNGFCNKIDFSSCCHPFYNSIINGGFQTISGTYNSILGGDRNTISSYCSAIVSGSGNSVTFSGPYGPAYGFGVVVQGCNNASNSFFSFIGNGETNIAGSGLTHEDTIVNGSCQIATGGETFIGSGMLNVASGNISSVVNGNYNVADGNMSFIGTGLHNCAHGPSSTIINGSCNQIAQAHFSIINTGCNHQIFGSHSAIINGCYNSIGDANTNFIGNGEYNCIPTGSFSSIINGGGCGGPLVFCSNVVASHYSTIGSGKSNNINVGSDHSMIGGGILNTISAYSSFIGNGTCNCITTGFSSVVSGCCNTISATYSFISSGKDNHINFAGSFNGILSGESNKIDNTYHSYIGGGCSNTITANGICSAILGGSGNLNRHCWSAVFGNSLVSCSDDTFHVSCLNAVNTPPASTVGLPVGTYAWKAGNALGASDCVLVII